MSSKTHRLVVVGGGVAGLQTARALFRAGFTRVTVLEESDDVGSGTSFKGINHEVPWSAAQMPEFPVSRCSVRPTGPFPTTREMQEYARAYAHAFNLYSCIKLNCKLVNLAPDAQNRWVVSYTNTKERRHYQITASFVVLCTGIHTTPSIPVFPGNEDFRGKIVHSKDLKDLPDLEGKRVVLVGNGRSQSDLQAEIAVAQSAGSVLLLNRKAHWPLPMRMGPISTKRILASRWGTSLVPRPYYAASGFSKAMSAAGQPMKRAVWWALKKSLNKRYKVKKANVIMEELQKDLHWGGHQSEQNWKTLTQQTKVHSITGRIRLMSPEGLVLDGGQEIACDVIVMCTGYTPNYRFIDPRVNLHLQSGSDGVYLYRHLIHPDVKNLAFVGSMVTSANYVLTTALQAEWLCRALQQHVKLPTAADMAQDIAAQRAWRKSFMRGGGSAGLLMPYTQQYHDQLMEDMGVSKYRKGINLFAEWFEPYSAADYASLFDPGIKRTSFKVKVNRTALASSSSAARSTPSRQAISAAGTAAGQGELVHGEACKHKEEQEQQAMAKEQREELRHEHKRQRQHRQELKQQNQRQQEQQPQKKEPPLPPPQQQHHSDNKRRQQGVQFQVVEDSQGRQQSFSHPLAPVKRRSVMFAVDPEEGMEEVSPREASRRRLSKSALDELEAKNGGVGNVHNLRTLSRNSAASFMTREVGSAASNSLFGDLLEGTMHSHRSDGGLLESKASHGQASAGHAHTPAGVSRQSSLHRRSVLGGHHGYSGAADICSDMSDLASGRPSPVGHPSTHGGSAYRADWFVRDSSDTRHTRASSKTIQFSDWDGFSTRHGSMRPSSGRPSTKATDLMHTSESSYRDFASGSHHTVLAVGQPTGTSHSGKLSFMNSVGASGSMRASGSMQTSGSQNDSSSRSMSRVTARTPNSAGDGDASLHGGRKEFGLFSPLRRPFRSSMPSASVPSVDEDGREGLPPYASEDGLSRPGIRLMMGRNSSAPLAIHLPDLSISHAAAGEHDMNAGGEAGHGASLGPALRGGSFSHLSQAGPQGVPRLERNSSPTAGVSDIFQERGCDPSARSSATGMLFGAVDLEEVSVRDIEAVGRAESAGAKEGLSAGRLLGVGDSEDDLSVTAWGSTRPNALSSGPPSSSARALDVAGHSGAHASAHVLDATRLNSAHSGGHSSAQLLDTTGLGAAHNLEGTTESLEGGGGNNLNGAQLMDASQDGMSLVGGPISSEWGWNPHGQDHVRGVPSIASAAAGSAGRRRGGCGHDGEDGGSEGRVCIVIEGAESSTPEGGAHQVLPCRQKGCDGSGSREEWTPQQQQQQQQQRSHSEEEAGLSGEDFYRSQEGNYHSEGQLRHTPPSGLHLFSGSQAENSSSNKVLDKRCDTFFMLSDRSSPLGPSANPSHALGPPTPTFQPPDLAKMPLTSQTLPHPQAQSSQFAHPSNAPTSQSLVPFSLPHHQPLQSAHTSKHSPHTSSSNMDISDRQGLCSASDQLLCTGEPVQLPFKPPPGPLSHGQLHSIPSSSHQVSTPQLPSYPSSKLPSVPTSPPPLGSGSNSTLPSPSQAHYPSSPPNHMSPRDGSAASGNTSSASTSYAHMVSNHMGVNGKMGCSRGAPGKHRSTLNDAAVLELLSAPPPIISSSRARCSKLKPPREGRESFEASEVLASKQAAPQHHSEGLPDLGPSQHLQHRRICSHSDCTEHQSDPGSLSYVQHQKEDLPDSGSSLRAPSSHRAAASHSVSHSTGNAASHSVSHSTGNAASHSVSHSTGNAASHSVSHSTGNAASHSVSHSTGNAANHAASHSASHSTGNAASHLASHAANHGFLTSASEEARHHLGSPAHPPSDAQGAEPQQRLSPFQHHSPQTRLTDVHNSDHSLSGSANDEDAQDGQISQDQPAEATRANSTEQVPLACGLPAPKERLGVIVSGESMSVTGCQPSLLQDAPCASGASISRHSSISERLSERFNAMLPAFMQKSRSPLSRGNGGSSTQRQSHSLELPKVEQSASSRSPLEVVESQHSAPVPPLGYTHKNRRTSIALGVLARNRENMRASSFSPGAPQSHPLASFLNRSSDGLNSQAGNLRTLGDFRCSSPSFGGPSPSGSASPPITTAAAAQHVFQGIINEGLGQLIEHHELQQQEAQARQQQVAMRAARAKATTNQRSSLSLVSSRHTEGALEETQPRASSFSNVLKGVQRKLS